ncbi:hypothetical protein [Cryptosporangium aurantiacum]|uniref:hypothetical protein n=1 Tax=Cryptosporangium aurantiacum TaxID=134849 RepID=UPI0015BB670A|nr:hypothetical protein [Cryptosporangium aurantiacum]
MTLVPPPRDDPPTFSCTFAASVVAAAEMIARFASKTRVIVVLAGIVPPVIAAPTSAAVNVPPTTSTSVAGYVTRSFTPRAATAGIVAGVVLEAVQAAVVNWTAWTWSTRLAFRNVFAVVVFRVMIPPAAPVAGVAGAEAAA